MRTRCTVVLGLTLLCSVAAYGQEQNPLRNIKWTEGPSVGEMSGTAEIRVPEGYVFAGANDTRLLMTAMHNPTSGQELGFVAPTGIEWFVVFEFDDIGYVRDDEKGALDADAMLESIKKGTEQSNKERQKRGWPAMTITGWEQPPRYNETTHNLEWAIKAESEGKPVVNYNTRLLGRSGVMRVTLVADPAEFPATLPKFKTVLEGYSFKQGQKYAEWKKGDKIAAYGLSALVVGGAAAVAAKAGLFKGLWKIIVVGFVALAAAAKSLWSRLFGKKPPQANQ